MLPNIEFSAILGRDFFRKHGVVLDYGNNTMLNMDQPPITLKSEVTIPPKSEMVVTAHIKRSPDGPLGVCSKGKSHDLHKGIHLSETLSLVRDNTMPVCISNSIQMYPDSCIAWIAGHFLSWADQNSGPFAPWLMIFLVCPVMWKEHPRFPRPKDNHVGTWTHLFIGSFADLKSGTYEPFFHTSVTAILPFSIATLRFSPGS